MTEEQRNPPRLTQGMNILSWDCGISNLCYCLLEEEERAVTGRNYRIVMWENFSLNSQTLMQAVSMLIKELDKRPWMMNADYVCIESQTLKNVQMKVISHTIQAYFESRGEARAAALAKVTTADDGSHMIQKPKGGPPVNFIKPENKFKIADKITIPDAIENLSRRRRNKKAAVYVAETLLRERHPDPTALRFLSSFDKQDDLSDSFLQGVYFLELMQKKREQKRKLKSYLGLSPLVGGEEEEQELVIAASTGTKDEEFDEGVRINEGCEYEKEVPLPQVYRNPHFVPANFDTSESSVATSTRFLRPSASSAKKRKTNQ